MKTNTTIKIYIANENDTIESICEKFSIDKYTFNTLNPIYKNKVKLANFPIKIPIYPKRESNIVIQLDKIFFLKTTYYLKTIITYKILKKENLKFFENKIFLLFNQFEDKTKACLNNYFVELLKLINTYQDLNEESFSSSIDYLKDNYQLFDQKQFEEYTTIIITYLNLMVEGNYLEAEKTIYEYMRSLKNKNA